MWLKWLPWRFVVSQLAKRHGFVDPISVLSRLHRFAQPSEVTEPVELLRAGVIFHARGLINTRTIQHNLDWVWPYWVERQFNPQDPSFIPRAFSITHVNLTHRNWTAVGLPGCQQLPIVDPRGLVTPLLDGWSLDAWIVLDDGRILFPSRVKVCDQRLLLASERLAVETTVRDVESELTSTVDVILQEGEAVCRVQYSAVVPQPGSLVIAPRPANPEGVSFIHEVKIDDDPRQWWVDHDVQILFDRSPDGACLSDYHSGDVAAQLSRETTSRQQTCDVGLVTSAAKFGISPAQPTKLTVLVPLRHHATWTGRQPFRHQPAISSRFRNSSKQSDRPRKFVRQHDGAAQSWPDALENRCELLTPEHEINHLFDTAVYSLTLHSPGEVYPGPYTYKRFWFRDAALIVNALLSLNLVSRAGRAIRRYPNLQTTGGYFHSQDGEWDSNGAAMWAIDRYRRLTGTPVDSTLYHAVVKGARWIRHKRVRESLAEPHAGLLPAGFSAEHLGPNDYYYWDDFWSVAGLRVAADMCREAGDVAEAQAWEAEAVGLLRSIDRSLAQTASRRNRGGIPASPYRRLDAGAIGSLAGSYPLQIWDPADARILDTVEFLLAKCMVRGGFFQDMIHSGINPYLTLHIAQVLLRSGQDRAQRYVDLVHSVAALASPTGQWPEAVHPHTGGGCMGDGQHIWAAAEWVLMLRNMFVREEGETLILCSGVPREWSYRKGQCRLGPTPTPFGLVSVDIVSDGDVCDVSWHAKWRQLPSRLTVQLPGSDTVESPAEAGHVRVHLGEPLATTH